jgi:hypothetical protein
MSEQPPETLFKYKAFLSYRNADSRQAAWLHKVLERYVVPRSLAGTAGEHGPIPKHLVVGTEETPENNGARVFMDRPVSSRTLRAWVPASDVILRVHSPYRDGFERALSLHLTLTPGWDPRAKRLRFQLPPRSGNRGPSRDGLDSARTLVPWSRE